MNNLVSIERSRLSKIVQSHIKQFPNIKIDGPGISKIKVRRYYNAIQDHIYNDAPITEAEDKLAWALGFDIIYD